MTIRWCANSASRRAAPQLVKMEGRVFVRFSGVVETDGLRVPYQLVPGAGRAGQAEQVAQDGPRRRAARCSMSASPTRPCRALHASAVDFVDEIYEAGRRRRPRRR